MARSRFKRKGKSKFIMIDGYIIRSAAWKSLSVTERAVYLELKWRYDGLNNGSIGLGERELGQAIHASRETARRALAGLVEKGFLEKAKPSGFNVKNRTATEWRLTEYPCDRSGQMPTKDFMRWQPEEKVQGHLRSAQGHMKPSTAQKMGEEETHRGTTSPVRPSFEYPQGHHKPTYNITMGGSSNA